MALEERKLGPFLTDGLSKKLGLGLGPVHPV